MLTIIIDELKRAFISIKTIIIVATFLLIDYYAGKYSLTLHAIFGTNAEVKILFSGFSILTTFFSFVLFSGIISRDAESGAIRYILPYIKRWKVIISKYLAMNIYFIGLLVVTLLILYLERRFSFPWEDIFSLICFFAYVQAIVILLSVLLKERMSTFIGLAIGFAFPILGGITNHSKNLGYQIINWLLPFRYTKFSWDLLVLLAITTLSIFLTIYLFNVKEV